MADIVRLHPRKALVIQQDEDGYFAVRMDRPLTARQRELEMRFYSHGEARDYAARIWEQFPALFGPVIDHTGGGAA